MVSPVSKLASVSTPDQALAVALDHLDQTFRDCRDFRHWWKVTQDFHMATAGVDGIQMRMGQSTYVARKLTCQNCGTSRSEAYQVVDLGPGWQGLRRLSVSYQHPEGYLLHGLPPGVSNAAELIRAQHWAQLQQAHHGAKPKARRRATKTTKAG